MPVLAKASAKTSEFAQVSGASIGDAPTVKCYIGKPPQRGKKTPLKMEQTLRTKRAECEKPYTTLIDKHKLLYTFT